ncbi:MAG: DUF899 family protein [Pseudomonadota bacterium]
MSAAMELSEADKLGLEIMEKTARMAELRRAEPPVEVANYPFETLDGPTTLSALFAGRDRMLVIHNMGQGCRFCTAFADGISGVVQHLEDAMAVVVVSKDAPALQRRLATDRGWRFRMASHGGGAYMDEQCAMSEMQNMPGAAVYERAGPSIVRRARTPFGPGDGYSPIWSFLALAGIASDAWTPQFHYWSRPSQMDDGGADLRD